MTTTRRIFLRVCLLFLVTVCAAGSAETVKGWVRLSTPEFTVVTSLPPREAATWVTEFSQYVAALRAFFKAPDRHLPPLTFVVFARERDFLGYRPLGTDGKPQPVAGFFGRQPAWAVAGVGGDTFYAETRRVIFHEGMHWFSSTAETETPVWLEEGLAEVFSTFRIAGDRVEWGGLLDDHVTQLRRFGLMPVEQLLYTDRGELFKQGEAHTGLVYAQSWVLAHYLTFGVQQISPTAVDDYRAHLLAGVGPDEAFRRAYGRTYRQMDEELKRYLSGYGSFRLSRWTFAPVSPPRPEPATRLDVEDALGRLALGGRRWELAAKHARAAIAASPSDPRGHEVLGFALKESGRAKEALAEFARAEELGTADAQVPFELAVGEQNEGADRMRAVASAPDPTATRRIADRYLRALALLPRFRTAYQNLALLTDALAPAGEPDRRALEAGKKAWPDDPAIEAGLAILAYKDGQRAEARSRLDRLVASSHADGAMVRPFARRVMEGWGQQEAFDEIERLNAQEHFAEALALVESRIAAGQPSYILVQLQGMQATLIANVAAQKIERAVRAERWTEARRLARAVLDGDGTTGGLRDFATRVLADLDRHGLGLATGK